MFLKAKTARWWSEWHAKQIQKDLDKNLIDSYKDRVQKAIRRGCTSLKATNLRTLKEVNTVADYFSKRGYEVVIEWSGENAPEEDLGRWVTITVSWD